MAVALNLLWVSGIDAKIIDEHSLRKGIGGIGISGPASADGDVEDDEEGMVEDPLGAGGEIGGSALGYEGVVDVEADVVGLPLDGVEVEGGVDGLACGEGELGGDAFGGAVAGAVQGAVDDGGF